MKKRNFFGQVFDPSSQPGYQSRYGGSGFNPLNLGKISDRKEKIDMSEMAKNPYREFNSRQVKEVNPNGWLRSKGKKI